MRLFCDERNGRPFPDGPVHDSYRITPENCAATIEEHFRGQGARFVPHTPTPAQFEQWLGYLRDANDGYPWERSTVDEWTATLEGWLIAADEIRPTNGILLDGIDRAVEIGWDIRFSPERQYVWALTSPVTNPYSFRHHMMPDPTKTYILNVPMGRYWVGIPSRESVHLDNIWVESAGPRTQNLDGSNHSNPVVNRRVGGLCTGQGRDAMTRLCRTRDFFLMMPLIEQILGSYSANPYHGLHHWVMRQCRDCETTMWGPLAYSQLMEMGMPLDYLESHMVWECCRQGTSRLCHKCVKTCTECGVDLCCHYQPDCRAGNPECITCDNCRIRPHYRDSTCIQCGRRLCRTCQFQLVENLGFGRSAPQEVDLCHMCIGGLTSASTCSLCRRFSYSLHNRRELDGGRVRICHQCNTHNNQERGMPRVNGPLWGSWDDYLGTFGWYTDDCDDSPASTEPPEEEPPEDTDTPISEAEEDRDDTQRETFERLRMGYNWYPGPLTGGRDPEHLAPRTLPEDFFDE